MNLTSSSLERLGPGAHLEPLTVAQYHAMMEHGIIREGAPIELLDGMLVRKDRAVHGEDIMTIGHRHRTAVVLLSRLSRRAEPLGFDMWTQQPITLGDRHEPEPDAAVVRSGSYADRHPGAADIAALIDVSDSSLAFDRDTKKRIYAEAGIREFWIVNLRENVVEVNRGPDPAAGTYRERIELRTGQSIRLELDAGSLDIAVADILPA